MSHVLDRFRGCLLGLAAGDALGTAVEFQPPGSFVPLTDMVGGGVFHLRPGQWTDDTSLALCLAESLIERQGFDPQDQMKRYLSWFRKGHLASNGRCFDIGNTTRTALLIFERTGQPFSGPTSENAAGNGSLMRLAPVPMLFSLRPADAIFYSGESSRTTHGAALTVDACRYCGGLLVGALNGVSKDELLSPSYSPAPGGWQAQPLAPCVAEVAGGSFKQRQPPEIQGSGFVVRALEAALWAFWQTEDFERGCLLAANLGDDADTTAAIYGQLGGAYYGEAAIPARWREKLALRDIIEQYATRLHELAGY